MRLVVLAIASLLLIIQWPLWFGKGGWLRVRELQHALAAQAATNATLAQRNQTLITELSSVRQGREAIEERARHELNMIRNDEVFFQLPAQPAAVVPSAANQTAR